MTVFADLEVVSENNCFCECNISQLSFIDPYSGGGYGKYCGIGYSCYNQSEPGCDALDECCRHHDICVGKTGYCDSCLCNIELIKCAYPLTGNGFDPCDKLQKAREIILKDICLITSDLPVYCGGCNDTLIPQVCKT